MKINDIVNIKSSDDGYWKGKIVEISDMWEYILKSGEVLREKYSSPIATIRGNNGISHALVIEKELEFRDGQYWEDNT